MAYAEVAGLPAIAGLWAAVAPAGGLRRARLVAPALGRPGVHHRTDDGGGDRRRWWPGSADRYAETAAALALVVGGCA